MLFSKNVFYWKDLGKIQFIAELEFLPILAFLEFLRI